MNNFEKKIQIYFIGIFLFIMIIETVIFISFPHLPLKLYILFAINTFLLIMAYWAGLLKGLILGMFLIFLYGTYLIYKSIIYGVQEVTYLDFMWIIFFALSVYFAGNLSLITKKLTDIQKFEELVLIDSDTGFGNEKKFYIEMSEEINRARRFNNPLSLMIVKIQYFNELSSIYGNKVTRNVVKRISECINKVTRIIDNKVRFAEDTFAIILPNTNYKGGQILKNRLIEEISTIEINAKSTQRYQLSFKIGLVELQEDITDAFSFKEFAEKEMELDVG